VTEIRPVAERIRRAADQVARFSNLYFADPERIYEEREIVVRDLHSIARELDERRTG